MKIFSWIALGGMVALYLYEIVAAIGNWQGMAQIAQVLSDGLSTQGIVWLTVGVAVPAVALILALLMGRKKTMGKRLLVLALGLTLVAVAKLDIAYLVPTTTYLGELAI